MKNMVLVFRNFGCYKNSSRTNHEVSYHSVVVSEYTTKIEINKLSSKEPEVLTPLISKHATGYDPDPVKIFKNLLL